MVYNHVSSTNRNETSWGQCENVNLTTKHWLYKSILILCSFLQLASFKEQSGLCSVKTKILLSPSTKMHSDHAVVDEPCELYRRDDMSVLNFLRKRIITNKCGKQRPNSKLQVFIFCQFCKVSKTFLPHFFLQNLSFRIFGENFGLLAPKKAELLNTYVSKGLYNLNSQVCQVRSLDKNIYIGQIARFYLPVTIISPSLKPQESRPN